MTNNSGGDPVRVVSLCGGPGPGSANRAALNHAIDHLETVRHGVSVVDVQLEGVPIFDPRLATDPQVPVIELGGMLAKADGVMIAGPEYAGGLAGGTKTVLDWLVGLV